ncbi:MAG: hypothetical protein GXP54_02130 [Deltaproteobacteria bacterium]|nr:hypothetical protein [Deltaproteobacteria bacterium]
MTKWKKSEKAYQLDGLTVKETGIIREKGTISTRFSEIPVPIFPQPERCPEMIRRLQFSN